MAAAPDATAVSAWSPVPELLTATVQMLEHALSTDNALQRQAYVALEQSKLNPEFLRYLVYCVVYGTGLSAGVRAVAGATTKAIVSEVFPSLPVEVSAYVKAEVVKLLVDPVISIRRMAANIVSTVLRQQHLTSWLALPPIMISLLSMADNASAIDGGLTAALQMFEDAPQEWDDGELGHPLSAIFPLLVALMGSSAEETRVKATKAAGLLLHTGAPALATNRHAYLAALAHLTKDPSPAVRESVSYSLGYLLETDAAGVWPSLPAVFEFELRCLADPSDSVSAAGADFFSGYAEAVTAHCEEGSAAFHAIDPFMERIVRALIARMVLTDEEATEAAASDAAAAAAVLDADADVEPTISRRARVGASGSAIGSDAGLAAAAGAAGAGGSGPVGAGGGDEDDDEEEEADTGRNPNAGGAFSPRKAAGGALEVLAMVHGTLLLPLAMAAITERLSATGDSEAAWRSREVALLALGCLAQGCSSAMAGYLPQLYPYLLQVSCDAARPLLRQSAVWTLSQYAGWVVEMHITQQGDGEGEEGVGSRDADYLTLLMTLLLERLTDPVKTVQHAALRAVVEVVETAQEAAGPYATAALAALLAAVPRYQLRSRLLAYDCISTLADAAPDETATPAHVAVLLPGLCGRLEGLPDDAFEVTVVLGCLTGVCGANRADTLPFMPRLLARACALLERELVMEAVAADEAAAAGGGGGVALGGAGNTARMSACLNLLDTIVDAAGPAAAAALTSLPDWLDLLLPHPSATVRAAALCLLGTIALRVPAVLAAYAPHAAAHLVPSLRLTADNRDACNNAVWALGLLAKAYGRDAVASCLPRALPRLLEVLFSRTPAARRVYENVAITLGLLGARFPEVMAPALPSFVVHWCEALRRVEAPAERADAYAGLFALLAAAPGPVAAGGHLPAVVRALLRYRDAPPEAVAAIRAAWGAVQAAAAPPQLAQLMLDLSAQERAEAATLLLGR